MVAESQPVHKPVRKKTAPCKRHELIILCTQNHLSAVDQTLRELDTDGDGSSSGQGADHTPEDMKKPGEGEERIT